MMDAKELANKMLEWGELAEKMAALESEINAAVLDAGKTQTVGNVRATYSKGRTTLDYESAARHNWQNEPDILSDWIEEYTTPTVNWRAICTDAKVDASEYIKSQSAPSIRIKLLGDKS